MDERFASLVSEALDTGTLSSGDDLVGFQTDLETVLSELGYVTAVEIEQSSDVRSKLMATLSVHGAHSEDQISNDLRRLWLDRLRYRAFEAHTIERSSRGLEFNFVTRSDTGLCVTGRILVVRH